MPYQVVHSAACLHSYRPAGNLIIVRLSVRYPIPNRNRFRSSTVNFHCHAVVLKSAVRDGLPAAIRALLIVRHWSYSVKSASIRLSIAFFPRMRCAEEARSRSRHRIRLAGHNFNSLFCVCLSPARAKLHTQSSRRLAPSAAACPRPPGHRRQRIRPFRFVPGWPARSACRWFVCKICEA